MCCLLVLVWGGGVISSPAQAVDPLKWVDPFIGVDRDGNVFPGACLPFSLVRLGPDTEVPQTTSGYQSGRPVIGFSHTRTSGTGGRGRYGNVLVTPQVGPLDLVNISSPTTNEKAEAGYYSVLLSRFGVKAELTQTARCGMHRYIFPASEEARILINACAARNTIKLPQASCRCLDGSVHIVSDRMVEGMGKFKGGWGNDSTFEVFFVAEFDRPFASSNVWENGRALDAAAAKGDKCGAIASFKTKAGDQIGLRVGVSFSSLENARNFLRETEGKTFDQVKNETQDQWRQHLNKIQVEGGSDAERKLFYTSLYRTVVMPTDLSGDNPLWKSDAPHFWDYYCLWDTFHCANSLYTLIAPEQHAAMIQSLIDIYQHRGWIPDAWTGGDFAAIQGGSNGDAVLGEAILKELKGVDARLAYEAIRKDATVNSPDGNTRGRYLDPYLKYGYLPAQSATSPSIVSCPTSRTLEYAYDDFCIALAARKLGNNEDYEKFKNQSLCAFNLYSPKIKFFWAKNEAGQWLEGFGPGLYNYSGRGPYYEGTPWQYSFSVPQDVQGLINRLGGVEKLVERLDNFFDGDFYSQGNEPDLLAPWLYTYAGRPDKNVDRVRAILNKNYKPIRSGLPGNDDAGTMSAWYVFGAMGFYPNAGQDVYLMSSPLFSKVIIVLGGGKKFVITANHLSPENKYIQSATLNGKPWDQAWFRHADIVDGAEMVLEMGNKPSGWGTKRPFPPSISQPLAGM